MAREVAFCPSSDNDLGQLFRNSHIDSSPGRSPDLLLVRRLGLKAEVGLPYNRCEISLHVLASPISRRFCLLMVTT